MKALASLIAIVGIAACSAHNMPLAASEAQNSDLQDILDDVVDDVVDKVKPVVTAVVQTVKTPCPAHLTGVGQKFADGMIAGFNTNYPELTQCLPENTCVAAQLGDVFDRIFNGAEPSTMDVLELEYILYTSFIKELQACQKTPKQTLEVAQIITVLRSIDSDPIYAIRHQLVNVALHDQDLYAKYSEAAKQFHDKHYERAGQLAAEAYLTVVIGEADDIKYKNEAGGDLAEVNVVALKHKLVDTVPDMAKYLTAELAAEFWPYLKYDNACSQDINAVRDDIIAFIDAVAKYMVAEDGSINPDWAKIADAWEEAKEKLALNIGEAMEDCTEGSSAAKTQDIHDVVKRTLQAQTIETMKPAILQAFAETDAVVREQAETEASAENATVAQNKAKVANNIVVPLIANAQGGLYMKTFGKYVKAADGSSSASIEAAKPDEECTKLYKKLETGLESAVDAYLVYNKTATRAIEIAVAAIDMYGEAVVKACFVKDSALAAHIAKEGVSAGKKAQIEGTVLIEGVQGAPTHASEKDSVIVTALVTPTPSIRGSKSIVSISSAPYWAAEIVYDEEDSNVNHGFPVKIALIVAAIASAFITLVTLASCLVFKCSKSSPASETPLLEGEVEAQDPSTSHSRAAAAQEPLPEELPAGV